MTAISWTRRRIEARLDIGNRFGESIVNADGRYFLLGDHDIMALLMDRREK